MGIGSELSAVGAGFLVKKKANYNYQTRKASGVTRPDALVAVVVDELEIGLTQADEKGNWSYTFVNEVAPGANIYSVIEASGLKSFTNDGEKLVNGLGILGRPFTTLRDFTDFVINSITYRSQSANNFPNYDKTYQLRKYDASDEYRFEVRSGDTWDGDKTTIPRRNRVEFSQLNANLPISGADWWYSDTLAIDSDQDHNGPWLIFNQMHYGFSGVDACLKFELVGKQLNIVTAWDDSNNASNVRLETQYVDANFPKKKWVRWVVQGRFGIGDGRLKITRDGVVVVDKTGINFGYPNHPQFAPYLKWGLYRYATSQTYAVRHINVEGAATRSLADRILNPLPIPDNGDIAAPDVPGVANVTLPKMAKTGQGDHTLGQTYTVTPGSWSGGPTLNRQWQSNGADIAGATGLSYTVAAAQVGSKELSCLEFPAGRRDLAVKANIPGMWILPPAEKIEGFDDLSRLTSAGTAHGRSIDTTRFSEGTGSIALTAQGASGSQFETQTTAAATAIVDPATSGVMTIVYDAGPTPALNSVTTIGASLMRASTAYSALTVGGRVPRMVDPYVFSFRPDQVATFKDLAPAATGLRVSVAHGSHLSGTARVDAAFQKSGGVPTVCFAFDDSPDGQYTIGVPMFQAANMLDAITDFVPRSNLGNAGRQTMAQKIDMAVNLGIEICRNGTREDGVINNSGAGRPTLAAYGTQFDEDGAWFQAQGFKNYRSDITVFPNGLPSEGATTSYITKTGCTVSGQVITVPDNTNIVEGMRVVGTGANNSGSNEVRVATGGINGTAITVTGTIAAGSGTFTFVGDNIEFSDDKTGEMLWNKGVRLMRTAGVATVYPTRFLAGGKGNLKRMQNYSISNNQQTLDQIKAQIDQVVSLQGTIPILVHNIIPGSTDGFIDVSQDKLQGIVDYVASLKQQQKLVAISLGRMLDRDLGSNYALTI